MTTQQWNPRRLALVGLIVAGACVPAAGPAPATQPETPISGGRLTVAMLGDVPDLNPLRVSDGAQFDTGGPLVSQLYEPLVTFERNTGEIVPALATWTVSPDGKTYEFEIRADAVWSDGQPIVAEDWLTVLRSAARSKVATSRGPLSRIEGAEDYRLGKATSIRGVMASGKHLTIRLDPPGCAFLSAVAITPPIPTQVFARYVSDSDVAIGADAAPEHLSAPVTSGPFVLKEWRRGDAIVLEANRRYWRGTPLLQELVFRTVDRSAVAGELQSGRVQVAFLGINDVETAHSLDGDPRLRVARVAGPNYTFIGWNQRSKVAAFRDKRIRQALAYGLDAELALQRTVLGEGQVVRGHMRPNSWAFTSGLEPYKYDPVKAQDLIRSAGYVKGADGIFAKDGVPLAFTLVTNKNSVPRALLVQFAADQYRSIGIGVTPVLDEFKTLVQRFADDDPTVESFVLGWVQVGDPNPAGVWHSMSLFEGKLRPANLVGYIDPKVDREIDAARFGPDCSVVARKKHYEAFDRILNEEQPYNFMIQQYQFVVISTRVRGLTPGASLPLPDSHLWWLAPQR